MEKLKIFLSHITVESNLADLLQKHLEDDFIGLVEVFVSSDRTSITAGENWLAGVADALKGSSLVVVLCSAESLKRSWINFEIGAAHVSGKKIVPFCHTDVTVDQLPIPLGSYESVLASKVEGIAKLYDVVSKMLGSRVPAVSFDSYAAEIQKFEVDYRKKLTATNESTGIDIDQISETVRNPRVLCIASPQFLEIGFQNQAEVVLSAFPTDLEHVRVTNSRDLQLQTRDRQFDIVHIAAFVCPRSGDLYFSNVDLKTGERTTAEVDIVPANALARLLGMAKTRLAVITSSDSLALAMTLLDVTNVVCTNDMLSPHMMAAWIEGFYGMLRKKSLKESVEYAASFSRAPMQLRMRRGGGDIVFTVGEEQKNSVSPGLPVESS